MSKEMMHRMKKAGEYQREAIRALFPEKVSGHLDVIEKEIKMMLLEIAEEVVKECKKRDVCEEKQEREKPSGAKKVDIM